MLNEQQQNEQKENKMSKTATAILIETLLQTSSSNQTTYNVYVQSITQVGPNLFVVVYDQTPKEGIPLQKMRRVAYIDTDECRIPWECIATDAPVNFKPVLFS